MCKSRDVLSDLCTGSTINISVEVLVINVEMFVVAASGAIDSDFFASPQPNAGSVLVEVWLGILTAMDSEDVKFLTASGLRVDMLSNVNANPSPAVTPA